MRRTIAMLIVIGCNAQHKDTQTLSPEPSGKPTSASGATAPSQDQEPNDEADDTATAERKDRALVENSLARFRAEAVDSTWASATQTFIQGELDKVSVKFPATVRVGRAECRQKTCLVETFHPNESTLMQTHKLLSQIHIAAKSQGGRLATAYQPSKNPDGSITDRVYFMYTR